MSQKRDYFRIQFPITQRPRLVAGNLDLEVLELSENGARVAVTEKDFPESSDSFPAVIRFKDGTTGSVVASIHRSETDQAILRFAENLPYSVIAAQQQRLIQLFPREVPK